MLLKGAAKRNASGNKSLATTPAMEVITRGEDSDMGFQAVPSMDRGGWRFNAIRGHKTVADCVARLATSGRQRALAMTRYGNGDRYGGHERSVRFGAISERAQWPQ